MSQETGDTNIKFYDVKRNTSSKIFPVEKTRNFINLGKLPELLQAFWATNVIIADIIAQDAGRDF
jgi:hypothetical protein